MKKPFSHYFTAEKLQGIRPPALVRLLMHVRCHCQEIPGQERRAFRFGNKTWFFLGDRVNSIWEMTKFG